MDLWAFDLKSILTDFPSNWLLLVGLVKILALLDKDTYDLPCPVFLVNFQTSRKWEWLRKLSLASVRPTWKMWPMWQQRFEGCQCWPSHRSRAITVGTFWRQLVEICCRSPSPRVWSLLSHSRTCQIDCSVIERFAKPSSKITILLPDTWQSAFCMAE